MKSNSKLYGIYLPIFILMLITTVTLRTVACLKYLLPSGHFSGGTAISIANWLTVATVVFFLTYIFAAKKDMRFIPSFSSPANYIPCAIVSAALLFVAVYLFSVSDLKAAGFLTKYTLILALLALLAIVYFAISAISVKRRSIQRSNLGILTLIFLCAYVAYIYFDPSLPINAPAKITDEMAFLAITLFFLYETRLSLGREKWRPYITFGFIAALLSAYSAFPALIVYFAKGEIISRSLYETVLALAFFIFVIFKLFLVGALIPENSSSVVKALITRAKARADELAPEESKSEESEEGDDDIDENQIAIDDITLQTVVVDAPTVEEGFLLEQELPSEDELTSQASAPVYADDKFVSPELASEEERSVEEQLTAIEEDNLQEEAKSEESEE